MAVKFSVNPTFWAMATLSLAGDYGVAVPVEFKCKFKRLKTSEHRAMGLKIEAATITDAEVLEQTLVDWEGFLDADNQPVPFTPDNLRDALEEWNGLEAAIVRSYFANAFPKAAEKN